jgi:predicted GNAT family acetyltransferase
VTEVTDNRELAHYEVRVDDQLAGFIHYRAASGVVTMMHTEVDAGLQRRGIGSALVAGALDDVRARGLKVRPQCPFVAAYIERHPEYAELVAP